MHLEAAAVDPQFRAFLDPELDIAFHLVELRARDHRAVIGRGIRRGSDLEALDARNEFFDQGVRGLFSDRHRHRDRHAALAGGAVAGADERIDRLIEVGVGHHDHMVLGAAEALHAFALGATGRVDVLGDRRRAHEADRLDTRVGDQRIHRLLVAVDHVEHARRQAGFDQQFGEPHRHRRVALRRFENERIATGERGRELPHRDHRWKVERRDAGHNAERLAQRIEVDAGAGARAELALEQVRDAAGELDHFEAALEVALGVGERLAVLAGEKFCERLELLLNQLQKLEQHARPPLRIGGGPRRLRRLRIGDCLRDFRRRGEGDLGLHLAGVRIEYVAEAPGDALHLFAADEVADLAHGPSPVSCCCRV